VHEHGRHQGAGAEKQLNWCLEDLSTPYLIATNHTDISDWGTLHSQSTRNPAGAVPGIQVDGYFFDTSTTNTYNGWAHDAQFVIRLPDNWNGKLVITGAPGVRKQYATDYLLSDWFVARGYAYAATDKGNSGTSFYKDGTVPGDAIAEWNDRVTELTLAAKEAVRQRYGQRRDTRTLPASRTAATSRASRSRIIRSSTTAAWIGKAPTGGPKARTSSHSCPRRSSTTRNTG
jgi:hypothetical protein